MFERACLPGSVPPSGSFSHRLESSAMPFLSVFEKESSSSWMISLTRAGSLRSSGKASPSVATSSSTCFGLGLGLGLGLG